MFFFAELELMNCIFSSDGFVVTKNLNFTFLLSTKQYKLNKSPHQLNWIILENSNTDFFDKAEQIFRTCSKDKFGKNKIFKHKQL
jgi:hypothetical protein